MTPGNLFAPEQLRIATAVTPAGTVRVQVIGEIDIASVTPLAEVLAAVVAERPSLIEVDLAGVWFMDSSGVNTLVRACHAAAAVDCRLLVTRPQRNVHQVLWTCGLLEMFGLRQDHQVPCWDPRSRHRSPGTVTSRLVVMGAISNRQGGDLCSHR
jgi:anti-anti-sigma factor